MNVVECRSEIDADELRSALSNMVGVEVEEKLFAKAGGIDASTLVSFVVASAVTVGAVAAAVVAVMSRLKYDDIKINGKIVLANLLSVEGAIEAKTTKGKNEG